MKIFSIIVASIILFLLSENLITGQETEVLFLSGTGSDNTVNWQFFCTEGRNSGKWNTIPVPSNWELQGSGKYNYGHDKDSLRGKEKGLYQYHFVCPDHWKDKIIRIVFEGSMTDTEVKINGKSAGPIHQGAFYRFQYDITRLVNIGQSNLLEVTVSKHSSNESVNRAERYADFWIFGGIFRPVYLEAVPGEHISRVAIKALADGNFTAKIYLNKIMKADEIEGQIYTLNNEKVGRPFITGIKECDSMVVFGTKIFSPLLWTPEFPNLYQVKFTLMENDSPIHFITERFGFRTIELRERDGIYLNGTKIKFRGVCRHSFWPTTGRALNKTISIRDVELMKDMNMNAVRNSHYPPDGHFLDVCDSLGLMVIDELAGWQKIYETSVGTKLVKEMVMSNGSHPCIIIWANGNEGGHNFELDPVFDETDFQERPVCHPWENFRGMNTQHYINYDYGNGTFFHGHDVFFPTEFLHGLYDGGAGAGLFDFWEAMWTNPLSAGGFLWDFADEGVIRTDRNGEIDTDGNHAPDGILGPFREKEASYFAIKEIWAPVFFDEREITPAFEGNFTIENRFFFTNINLCSFRYRFVRIPDPSDKENPLSLQGEIKAPDIPPCQKGILQIDLPDGWQDYDILYIIARDPHGREIYTWDWPVKLPEQVAERLVEMEDPDTITEGLIDTDDPDQVAGSLTDAEDPDQIKIAKEDSLLVVSVKRIRYGFNHFTGLIDLIENNNVIIPFNNGPVLCDGTFDYQGMESNWDGANLVLNYKFGNQSNYREMRWVIYPSGWLMLHLAYRPAAYEFLYLGISFSYPENLVSGVRWMGDGPYRVWKNRMEGNNLGVWQKDYNNTVTGEKDYIYPEFKGYHSRLYWVEILTGEQPFLIVTPDEDIFLRLFTPEFPDDAFNTAPAFPAGDISFMHAIPPVGTKSQLPENLGPSGKKNMYFDYWKQRPKEMTLYFNFSGD